MSFVSVNDMISILLGLFSDNSCRRLLQEQFNFLIVTVRVTLRLLATSVGDPHQRKHGCCVKYVRPPAVQLLHNPAGFVCSSSWV